MSIFNDPTKRHDAVLFFDVLDGNPNGDPDAGNLPRVDPESMQGLVTDVALKRKVRNYVSITQGSAVEGSDPARNHIFIQGDGIALNTLIAEGVQEAELDPKQTKRTRKDVKSVQAKMCGRFFDIRAFGAVMSTGPNAGQVKGPLQLTFSRSVDPIIPLDVSITRVAITRAEDADVVESEDGKGGKGKTTEMGRKALVPYGLYRCHIYFSPHQAADTGFDATDLELFWIALQNMWDFDRSAARGSMACRGLYVFSHESPFGNAPAHKLLERVTAARVPQAVGKETAARSFSDYIITLDEADLPPGVRVTRLDS